MTHGLSDGVLGQIRRVLGGHPEVEQAVLYGSRAKGVHRPGSDIDLTLKGAGLDHGALTKIADDLDDLMLPYRIDLSLFADLGHLKLQDHIRRVGVVLYARDDSLRMLGSGE